MTNQKVTTVKGKNDESVCATNPNSCIEGNLDVQYMLGIGQNIPLTYWKVTIGTTDPFLDWLMQLANDSNPPLVHSISYGYIEAKMDKTTMGK